MGFFVVPQTVKQTVKPVSAFAITPQPVIRHAPPAPQSGTPIIYAGTGRPDFKTFYDESRIIDRDKLKLVSDMRTEGSERGETQSGDNGTLGPDSNGGAFMHMSRDPAYIPDVIPPKKLTGEQIAFLAIASYLIFGA